MKYIFIFLNNKLITCDTILPFIVDLKKHDPNLKIKFFTFNIDTLNIIYKNTNLINIIKDNGSINVIGWLKKDYSKIIRVLFKAIHILQIIFLSFLCNCKNIHFKGLERFPFNLIYLFNKTKTFLFESNCWGYSINVIKADNVFYDNRKRGEEIEFKAYNYLIGFSKDWPQLNFCKNNKKKAFLIPSTRISKNWLDICKNQAKIIPKENPIWMGKNYKTKKKIIYVLGYLGKFSTIDKHYTGEILLFNTLTLILKNTSHIILLKPHAITDIKKLTLIINKLKSNRVFITYNHMAVISHYCSYALANYFSFALTDAWITGLKVIEYTKYDSEVLDITNGKSVVPQYVDSFINDRPELLIKELKQKYEKFKRTYPSEFNKNYSELKKEIIG